SLLTIGNNFFDTATATKSFIPVEMFSKAKTIIFEELCRRLKVSLDAFASDRNQERMLLEGHSLFGLCLKFTHYCLRDEEINKLWECLMPYVDMKHPLLEPFPGQSSSLWEDLLCCNKTECGTSRTSSIGSAEEGKVWGLKMLAILNGCEEAGKEMKEEEEVEEEEEEEEEEDEEDSDEGGLFG
ncbi:hypothetical protein ADUPG1_000815, partial [Aduncisulcus paluster]